MNSRIAWTLLVWGGWSALASTVWAQGTAAATDPQAPASASASSFDGYKVLKQPCDMQAASLQEAMKAGVVEAYLLAASLFELGGCLKQSDARANELLQEAARLGSTVATRRLAVKFAFGVGVPQSYATAGAWINGKGFSGGALTKEDYSLGYACGILDRAMQNVSMPTEAFWNLAEADLKITVPAFDPRKAEVVVTSKRSRVVVVGSRIARNYGLDYEEEFRARIDEAVKQAVAPNPALLVETDCRTEVSFNFVYDTAAIELARQRAVGRP